MGLVQRDPGGKCRGEGGVFMRIASGCDAEKVSRFTKLLEKEHFCSRVFTDAERVHIEKSGHREQTAAGIYCAKEAISKALGRGLFGLLPQELGVEWDANGAPYPVLTGSAARQYGHLQLSVSITHTTDTAFAVCVALEE